MALIFELKLFPASGKQKCTIDATGRLKCYVKAAPEKGKANKELLAFLADSLEISKASVELIAGFTVQHKKIRIEGNWTYAQVLKKLGLESGVQGAIFSVDGN
ncbi:MAG: DUF167 domain-containing protein [Candidatus Babeliales bacterium]